MLRSCSRSGSPRRRLNRHRSVRWAFCSSLRRELETRRGLGSPPSGDSLGDKTESLPVAPVSAPSAVSRTPKTVFTPVRESLLHLRRPGRALPCGGQQSGSGAGHSGHLRRSGASGWLPARQQPHDTQMSGGPGRWAGPWAVRGCVRAEVESPRSRLGHPPAWWS